MSYNMAAALLVDWNEVKTVALAVGVREAARQMGISEEAVMKRCSREGWLAAEEAKEQKIEAITAKVREERGMSATVRTAAEIMRSMNGETRFGHAVGAHKVAQKIQQMDADELFMSAPLILQHAKHAQATFGWAQVVEGSVRLDVLASGAGDSAPVIDI